MNAAEIGKEIRNKDRRRDYLLDPTNSPLVADLAHRLWAERQAWHSAHRQELLTLEADLAALKKTYRRALKEDRQ